MKGQQIIAHLGRTFSIDLPPGSIGRNTCNSILLATHELNAAFLRYFELENVRSLQQ